MTEQNISSIICTKRTSIIKLSEYKLDSYVKGYHVYKDIWKRNIGDVLKTEREPRNPVDKYAVAVMQKKNLVVGHLKKGTTGKFAKLISYFLKNDRSLCDVIIKGKHVNLGDGEGMQVPCELLITGYELHIEILKKELVKLEENIT